MATKKEIAVGLREVLAAEGLELNKGESEKVVSTVFEVIFNKLAQGEEVKVAGFGGWEVKDSAPRKGHNPQTKEEIEIPASKRVGFKSGSALKIAVKALV